jgi:hypothetical protein
MADDIHVSMMQEAETEGTGRRGTLKKTLSKVALWTVVILLGVRFLYLIGGPDETSIATTAPRPSAQPRSEWGSAVAPTSPCNSGEKYYTYEASKPEGRPFNLAGQCGPALWHGGHCVWVLGYKSNTPVRRCDPATLCTKEKPCGDIPLSIEYAWSADGYAFQDKVRLDPPRNTTLFQITQ